MRNPRRRKLSTLALTFALILSLAPLLSLSGQTVSATPSGEWELIERGTTFNRYYNPTTGTYAIEISGPINYKDNMGAWHPIDVNFIASDYGYEITKAPYQAYLENDINKGKGAKFCVRDHWFTYKLSGGKMQWTDNVGGKINLIRTIKSSVAEVENNRIRYENAFLGTAVVYQAMNYGLKELFILNALPAFDNKFIDAYLEYTGKLSWDEGLSVWVDGIKYPKKTFTTSSRVEFRDSENKLVFFLIAPYAEDNNGSRCDAIYDVRVSGTEIIRYGLRVPYSWLSSAVYPVIIDPSSVSLSDPMEDGDVRWDGSDYSRGTTFSSCQFGCSGDPVWTSDRRAYVEWDISSLAGYSLAANPVFKYHGFADSATDGEINQITKQPSICGDGELYGYIASGTAYVDPFSLIGWGGGRQVNLGPSAKFDLQAAINASQSWWAIGFQSPNDEGTSGSDLSSSFRSEEYSSPDPPPTLFIEYTMWAPDPPTSLLCEGQTNPTRIIELTPEFSAVGTDNEGDQLAYYALQVDDDNSFDTPIYNKTKTSITLFDNGERCENVSYENSDLVRGTTYYWRIKFGDIGGIEGNWSTETATFRIAPLWIAEISVDNTLIDRDNDHSSPVDKTRIYVTAKDNDGRDFLDNVYFWIRDNTDAVVVDNVIHQGYENLDDNTKGFWYDYNPPDDMGDGNLGKFDVKAQVVATDLAESTEDYTDLGFELFTVDDHDITFIPARSIYVEGEVATFEPVVKSVATGLGVENVYLKFELISGLDEVLRTITGYTNSSGKLVSYSALVEIDVGDYDVRISTSEENIDGLKLFEDSFKLIASKLVVIVSITPSDDSVSGLLRSRSLDPESVILKVSAFDEAGTEILTLTSDPLSIENVGQQLKYWTLPYGLTLAEGTYSYRVDVWKADLSTLHDTDFDAVRLKVAPSQQALGEWVVVDTVETRDNRFDVVLRQESIITNPTTVNKSNFMFRGVVPAPTGSTVEVKVGGLSTTTQTVDEYGTVIRYFDVQANTTVHVEMEVTISCAVKIEELAVTEVVVPTGPSPRTMKKHTYKITNLTNTVLRELELTFPVTRVVSVADEDGVPIVNFREAGSTAVEIPSLGVGEELTLILMAEQPPSLDRAFQQLVTWTIFGIPIIVYLLGAGALLWLLTKHVAGPFSQFIILVLPTGLVVLGLLVGWL